MPEDHADTVSLGQTDVQVSRIGLGCWQFANSGMAARFWRVVDDATIDGIVGASLEGGVNWFDTAEAYGWGESERRLSASLQRCGRAPGDVVVATKWVPVARTPASLGRTIGKRQKALSPFGIDLHQIHSPFGTLGTEAGKAEQLAGLVRNGHTRAVGVSNYPGRRMARMHALLAEFEVPLASNQVRYNLLDRAPERSVIPRAKDLGITVIAYSPLAQGVLTGKFHDGDLRPAGARRLMGPFSRRGLERSRPVVEVVRRLAESHDVSPARVALRWVLQAHGETVVAIPGATKVRHAEDNVGALGFELSDAEMDELNEVSSPFA